MINKGNTPPQKVLYNCSKGLMLLLYVIFSLYLYNFERRYSSTNCFPNKNILLLLSNNFILASQLQNITVNIHLRIYKTLQPGFGTNMLKPEFMPVTSDNEILQDNNFLLLNLD